MTCRSSTRPSARRQPASRSAGCRSAWSWPAFANDAVRERASTLESSDYSPVSTHKDATLKFLVKGKERIELLDGVAAEDAGLWAAAGAGAGDNLRLADAEEG